MEDSEVIKNHLAKEAPLCFSILYNRYAGKVYSKCISLLKDEALAQDATQEIFTKIFINLSRFGERSKFSTWLYSITYNYCIDYLRKQKKQKDLFSDDIEKAPDLPDDDVDDKELFELSVTQLKKALDEMPVDDRAILLMKYQDDLSIKEIAEMLDKTESAIKMRLKRAKAKAQSIRNAVPEKGIVKKMKQL
jgi:RNA polymerase sigma-70 factor (ECF subfamily)